MCKKVLCILLIFIVSSVCYAKESIFSDINNHWAKHYIEQMIADGSVNGYADGSFKPEKEITVAEFIKMILTENNIKLIKIGKEWPDWYIITALSKGYITENDIEKSDAKLTRIKACEILDKYIGSKVDAKTKTKFSDLSKEKEEMVLKLVALNIVSGYKDGTFRENELVTRAQACKLVLESYLAKEKLNINNKFELSSQNTNIGTNNSGDSIFNERYEIKNNRLYIHNGKNYNNPDGITLNQEYIKDEMVIDLIKALVDDDSYTKVLYVPDKYIINSLNVCYGQNEGYVDNGIYNFYIRFYENGFYNVAKSTDTEGFSEKAYAMIELDRMWNRSSEFENETKSSLKSLYKLEEAVGAIMDKRVKDDFVEYAKEKLVEAASKPDMEFDAKILETKRFGKFQVDVMCTHGQIVQFYISYF